MIIHQRPAVNIIELVQGFEELPNTVTSRLPRGVLLPIKVRYAVVDGGSNNDSATDIDNNTFGRPFALGALGAPLPADIASADLFVVPYQVSNNFKQGLDSILERLIRVAKPGAVVVIAAPAAAASNIEEITSPMLKAKGFEIVSCMSASAECLVLYRYTGSNEKQRLEKLTNGPPRKEVAILEPIASSPESQLFSKKLQNILKDQSYSVTTKIEVFETDAVDDKICISLLELEKPMLENLSEPDFQSIRKLMVSCERLLWITCGDNPSLEIVDGLARCVNVEVAGAKFQVLHLSSEGVQDGPSLAVRILKSSDTTADNEFREQGGLLQVPRLYKSPGENKHIRNHLKDSTQVMSLNDNSAPFRLTIGRPGLLDSLHFVRDENVLVTPLADDELELQVKATGVNFRDIMASMNLVPVTGLGVEASGIVLRTGSCAAKSFKPGDRVSTMSMGGTHATKTRCDFRVTAKIPDTMSFEEGAATPTVHATAYYILVKMAKLRRGQSILIHVRGGTSGGTAGKTSWPSHLRYRGHRTQAPIRHGAVRYSRGANILLAGQ